MIYKFRDPLFSNKIFRVKKNLLDNVIYDAIEDALFSLKKLDSITDVKYDKSLVTNRRQRNIQFTYNDEIGVRIEYQNKSGNDLTYDMEISVPKFDVNSTELIINGVKRQPLWQIIDHFSNSERSIHLVCSCISVHMTKTKGFIGIADKSVPIGNIFCYEHSLDEFLKLLNYRIIESKENKKGETLRDVLSLESTIENNPYEEWINTFLDQKIKDDKFQPKSKDFWLAMCQVNRFKAFNMAKYLEFIYTADVFTRNKLKYNSISDELFYRFINDDYDKDRYNVMNKQLYLVQWILSPLILEILNFLTEKSSYKSNKKRIIDIAAKISSQMSELSHLAEHHGINCIHGLSETLKMSYSGPQGFDPKNVPSALKDLQKSYYKNVDPIHTPDRKQTGVINWLTIKSNFFNDQYKGGE